MPNTLIVSRGAGSGINSLPTRPAGIQPGDMQVVIAVAPSTKTSIPTVSGWTLQSSSALVANCPRIGIYYKTYVVGETASPNFGTGAGTGNVFVYSETYAAPTLDIANGFLQSWGTNPVAGAATTLSISSPSGIGAGRVDGLLRGLGAAQYSTTPTATWTKGDKWDFELYDAIPFSPLTIGIFGINAIPDVGTLSGMEVDLSTGTNKIGHCTAFYVLSPIRLTQSPLLMI